MKEMRYTTCIQSIGLNIEQGEEGKKTAMTQI